MAYTALYIAFGFVALWLLGEVLLQYKARLRWRALAFVGFLGVVCGVYLGTVVLIGVGAAAFATGQTFVTISYRRGFSTGWALGGRPGTSRRRRTGGAGAATAAPDEFGVEPAAAAQESAEFAADPAEQREQEFSYQAEPAPESTGEYPGYGPQQGYPGDYPTQYDVGSYDPAGYEQTGFEQARYEQAGYDQGGYDQSGYDQGGYQQYGYPVAQDPAGTAQQPNIYADQQAQYPPAGQDQNYGQPYETNPYPDPYAAPADGGWVPEQQTGESEAAPLRGYPDERDPYR